MFSDLTMSLTVAIDQGRRKRLPEEDGPQQVDRRPRAEGTSRGLPPKLI